MTLIVLIKLSAAIVSVALGAGILARDHGLKANRLIAAFLFCNAFWAVTEFFLFQPQDLDSALLLFRVMTLGWVPLGVLCMHASLALSAMEDHPIARTLPIFYAGCAVLIPVAIFTDLVIAGVETTQVGLRPLFGPGFLFAYALMATPLVMILACWRRTMMLREPRGQLQLARVVFFGLSASLVVGTITAVLLPILGFSAVGVTTSLVGFVGLAVNRTLHRYGHSLISPDACAREILDTLEDGVVLLAADGRIRDVNRTFLRMVGVREADAIGRPLSCWIAAFPRVFDQLGPSTFLELETHEGDRVPVLLSAPVACKEGGRLVGHAFLIRDRREVVALQRRVFVSARLAAVGDLSKSISQSIREPAEQARDDLERLSRDWQELLSACASSGFRAATREEIAEGLELLEECAEGVERITSIVREVGKFSSESPREDVARHNFAEIVSRALRVARAQAKGNVAIEEQLDPDVDILGQAEEIERVVANILINALHALEDHSGKQAHLAVAVAAQNGLAVLHVEDNGCGIAPEALERIFDPFFTTKPVGKGTGLGLAISYHIVKAHGGEVRVSSIEGRGTSVAVELPRAPWLPGHDDESSSVDGPSDSRDESEDREGRTG